jgi:CubicO group peptidase (beta-lactamase class C family)
MWGLRLNCLLGHMRAFRGLVLQKNIVTLSFVFFWVVGGSTPCAFARSANEAFDQFIYTHGVQRSLFDHAQVLVGQGDRVLHYQTYHYDRGLGLYDIASLSKVIATAPAFWQLVDKNVIEPEVLTARLQEILDAHPFAVVTKDLLAQQAPLHSGYCPKWIGWRQWVRGFTPTQAARWKDRYQQELQQPRNVTSGRRQYSDLAYYFVQQIIEEKTQQALDEVVHQEIFEPYRMHHTHYGASLAVSDQRSRCVPNLSGVSSSPCRVHDPMCSLLGGVCGHAGVFSNALDLGKFVQAWMRSYPADVQVASRPSGPYDVATKRTSESNARNYGGWKVKQKRNGLGYVMFHEGFTGTTVYMDPTNQFYYVFLANASHKNKQLGQLHANVSMNRNFRDQFHRHVLALFETQPSSMARPITLSQVEDAMALQIGQASFLPHRNDAEVPVHTPKPVLHKRTSMPSHDSALSTTRPSEDVWNRILSWVYGDS